MLSAGGPCREDAVRLLRGPDRTGVLQAGPRASPLRHRLRGRAYDSRRAQPQEGNHVSWRGATVRTSSEGYLERAEKAPRQGRLLLVDARPVRVALGLPR